MAKIKYTKTELKRQRDALKQFSRYLPTLQLKKQQLQVEVQRTADEVRVVKTERDAVQQSVEVWVEILNRPEFMDLQNGITVEQIQLSSKNIAGIDVPVLEDIVFNIAEYDLFTSDSWYDAAVEATQKLFQLDQQTSVLKRQQELLEMELRTTSQRVNLFEKVKIPEAKENIRVIQIALGDEMTAGVCRSKIAKSKAVKAAEAEAAAEAEVMA